MSEGPVLPVRQPGPRGGEVLQVLVPLVQQSEQAWPQERDTHTLLPAHLVSLDTVHRVVIHNSCGQNHSHAEASGETHPPPSTIRGDCTQQKPRSLARPSSGDHLPPLLSAPEVAPEKRDSKMA